MYILQREMNHSQQRGTDHKEKDTEFDHILHWWPKKKKRKACDRMRKASLFNISLHNFLFFILFFLFFIVSYLYGFSFNCFSCLMFHSPFLWLVLLWKSTDRTSTAVGNRVRISTWVAAVSRRSKWHPLTLLFVSRGLQRSCSPGWFTDQGFCTTPITHDANSGQVPSLHWSTQL